MHVKESDLYQNSLVAAPRQSAANFLSEKWRRSADTPLRGGCAWTGISWLYLLALLCCFFPAFVRASEPAPSFDQANKLYEEGKHREAAAAYGAVLQQGRVSPALFFNLGNALFKSGQMGRAIIAYRLAEQLSPRDPDIKANLQFARDSIGGGTAPRAKAVWRFFSVLTSNELAVLVLGGLWILFALLIVKAIRPALASSLRTYIRLAAICAVSLGLWLGVLLNAQFRLEPAVVVASEAVVRYGPFDESQSSFTLRDGAELTVLDGKEAWLQVRDARGRLGWLHANQVARVAPEGLR